MSKIPDAHLSRAQKALAARPGDQGILCAVATNLMRLGRVEEAEECFRKSLAVGGQHTATLVNFAVLCERCGKNDEACELYKKALDANPSNPSALSNYAHSLCRRGDYHKAEVGDATHTHTHTHIRKHSFSCALRMLELTLAGSRRSC